jgi:hypothetical protein
MGRHIHASVVWMVVVVSCGGSGPLTTADVKDVTDSGAAMQDQQDQEDRVILPDLLLFDLPAPLDLVVGIDASSDAEDPAEGAAGWPCQTGDDCLEALCIVTADGKQCTQTCQEECPFGWSCLQYAPSLPDQVFVCAPRYLSLCSPCRNNADCMTNGVDAGQKCLNFGGSGSFCGGACDEGEMDCPPGYGCSEVQDVSGATTVQCVAQESCTCSQLAIDGGAATDCFVANDAGLCSGERRCLAEGLTACSAAIPAPESCNGIDDDCDGLVDEEAGGESCFVTNQYGACPGVEACVEGKLLCQGDGAEFELCDGKDNDCDGEVDEQFPDTDDDGVADCLESDKDGDGIPDGPDNCPSVFNPKQDDFDLDSLGDACDLDDDNDLIADEEDCAPKDPAAHPGADEICDGKDNDCNALVDEGFADTDYDGWKDCVDDDDDNDGANDLVDCQPENSSVFPGAVEACNGLDDDCDQQVDEGHADLDEDGLADCVDDDADGDGIGPEDNCPLVVNPQQADADQDGIGDLCDGDADGDAIPDGVDNCPLVQNPLQTDLDEDGDGDQCDLDDDGDGDPDEDDCAPLNAAINSTAAEVCDALDNDCNGFIDDGLGEVLCGKGACQHLIPLCANGVVPLCDPYDGAAVEQCDGADNDCDGLTDEDLGMSACGLGVCAHVESNCVEGLANLCDPLAGVGEEVCDGLDNDCDGKTDEEQPVLACGKGQCFHTQPSCIGGQSTECDPFLGALPESCDALDNDCDGDVDEGLGQTSCGFGECAHTIDKCANGTLQVCNPFSGASPESCDGLDNDCDGLVDEDLGTITCGLGICQKVVPACVEGQPGECDPLAGGVEETCGDGLDNDCDGKVDVDCGPDGDGVCLGKVCCNMACNGPCVSCQLPDLVGTCVAYQAGTDPEAECGGFACDGSAATKPGTSGCHTSCTDDNYKLACTEGNHCDEGACLLNLEAGEPCDEDSDCVSGYCRADWDGDGAFCAADDTGCVDDDDGVIVQHPDGWVECDGGTAYSICQAGTWTSKAGNECGPSVCNGGCGFIALGDNLCLSGTQLGVDAGCEFEDLGGVETTCVDCNGFMATMGGCNNDIDGCSVGCGAPCEAGETLNTNSYRCYEDALGDPWTRVDGCGTDGAACFWADDGHLNDLQELAACDGIQCVDGACLESCAGADENCKPGYFCGPDNQCYASDGLLPWAMSGDFLVLTKTDATYFAGTDCPGNFFGKDETLVSAVPFRVGPYNPGGTMNGLTANQQVPAPFGGWTINHAYYIFPGGRCGGQTLSVSFKYEDGTTATTGTASIPHDCSSAGTWSGSNYTIEHQGTYGGPCCDHWHKGTFTNPNIDKKVSILWASYSDGCGGTYDGQLWAVTID